MSTAWSSPISKCLRKCGIFYVLYSSCYRKQNHVMLTVKMKCLFFNHLDTGSSPIVDLFCTYVWCGKGCAFNESFVSPVFGGVIFVLFCPHPVKRVKSMMFRRITVQVHFFTPFLNCKHCVNNLKSKTQGKKFLSLALERVKYCT